MKMIVAQQQREIRERDEFPILRPPLAARREMTKEKRILTEMETSAGPSEWEDNSRDVAASRHDEQETEAESHPEMKMTEERTASPKKEKKIIRGSDERDGGEEEVPCFKVPRLPPATPSSARTLKRRKERINKGNEEELTRKIDWMMREMETLKEIIRGKETKEVDKDRGKQRKGDKIEKRREDTATFPRTRGKERIQERTWSAVVEGEKRKSPLEGTLKRPITPKGQDKEKKATTRAAPSSNVPKRKLPKTAAVVLTCPPGQYNEIMKEAKDKINIKECGIEKGIGIRRALTGALAFEFPGPESQIQADNLTKKLNTLFQNREGVRVTRPTKMAELRIRDLEDSIMPDEITYVITQEGGCHHSEVRVGPIKRGNDGLGVAWVRCPLSAAVTIANKGRVQVGWTNARIQLLDQRPLQCYKCLEGGHVRDSCKSEVDRSKRCYRCGTEGHKAQGCYAPPRCPVCADLGRPANHRAGNKACSSAHTQRRRPASRIRGGDVRTQATTAAKTKEENFPTEIAETKKGTTIKAAAAAMSETDNETEVTEAKEIYPPPKPQRVKKLPKIMGVELVDVSLESIPDSQDKRDREQRAIKALKITRRTVARRSSMSEEELDKTSMREPEDSERNKKT